ncbi:MAG: recombination protein RecR [Flavobacteriales bacterium]|jgi:recombination protein RecR|nr:recombination protein RecR [Flavobacteriales bacterium]MBT4882195.1 recombination protein RecR [Flavobacteriales bacterium]MDC3394719.1 recombination mediator RecR [Flavobacteriales bacterium]MDG1349108.1 recombination mediator RecR [Flavobacteriales bacterium]|tara:strand:- start:719 stop:1336 length:618 start_codon:yes stop_codon:yes gene_type:complete
MNFPSKLVENAVEHLSRLPGIGKRSALRLVLHMLKQEKNKVEQFGDSFIQLINNINYCTVCYSISDTELCEVCASEKRDKSLICVVEDIRVMMAIENTMQFKGVYHVLGGLISPMDGVGPNDLRIEQLISKVDNGKVKEVIFALSTTMEGDTTNYYLFRRLKDSDIKISSIARGIAIGDELEYTDELTLGTALSSRMPYENSLAK